MPMDQSPQLHLEVGTSCYWCVRVLSFTIYVDQFTFGGPSASCYFLLLRQGSTSKGFSEPLTERFYMDYVHEYSL